jgi:hypothetical protein
MYLSLRISACNNLTPSGQIREILCCRFVQKFAYKLKFWLKWVKSNTLYMKTCVCDFRLLVVRWLSCSFDYCGRVCLCGHTQACDTFATWVTNVTCRSAIGCSHIPDAMSPWQLHFLQLRIIFVDS